MFFVCAPPFSFVPPLFVCAPPPPPQVRYAPTPPPPPTPPPVTQLQSTCHYTVNRYVKIWHVHLGCANNIHPLSWGGGGHKRKRSKNIFKETDNWYCCWSCLFQNSCNRHQHFEYSPAQQTRIPLYISVAHYLHSCHRTPQPPE